MVMLFEKIRHLKKFIALNDIILSEEEKDKNLSPDQLLAI